jgi:hypothetical protein
MESHNFVSKLMVICIFDITASIKQEYWNVLCGDQTPQLCGLESGYPEIFIVFLNPFKKMLR